MKAFIKKKIFAKKKKPQTNNNNKTHPKKSQTVLVYETNVDFTLRVS